MKELSPLMASANTIEALKGAIFDRNDPVVISQAIAAVEAIPQRHRDTLVWTEQQLLDMVQHGRRLVRLHEEGRW